MWSYVKWSGVKLRDVKWCEGNGIELMWREGIWSPQDKYYELRVSSEVKWCEVTWSGVKWSDVKLREVVWSEVVWGEVMWSEGNGIEVKWREGIWSPQDKYYELRVSSEVKWCEVTWSDVKLHEVNWSGVKWSGVKWSDVKWREWNWSEEKGYETRKTNIMS